MQKILKTDTSNQTATFVVLEPWVMDYNGQIIAAEEVVKTAHEFMQNLQDKYVNVNHEDDTKVSDVIFVESFITPVDIPVGDITITQWTWLVALKFLSEDKWKQLIDGEITGISMEWYGTVE